jgi:hypothetical protein
MTDLRDDLRALGDDLAWPATPDLAAAVHDRLAAPAARAGAASARRGRPRRGLGLRARRRVVIAIAFALLLVPAAAMAVPASRHAVLDALGLRHVSVQRRQVLPHAARSPKLGDRVDLPKDALVPAALGAPDAVYARAGIITLVYDRPRVLVAQARGGLNENVLQKVIGFDDRARATTVGGRPALFLADPHTFHWTDATGPPVRSGPALIWEDGDRVLRLEGERSLEKARAIAASVR